MHYLYSCAYTDAKFVLSLNTHIKTPRHTHTHTHTHAQRGTPSTSICLKVAVLYPDDTPTLPHCTLHGFGHIQELEPTCGQHINGLTDVTTHTHTHARACTFARTHRHTHTLTHRHAHPHIHTWAKAHSDNRADWHKHNSSALPVVAGTQEAYEEALYSVVHLSGPLRKEKNCTAFTDACMAWQFTVCSFLLAKKNDHCCSNIYL